VLLVRGRVPGWLRDEVALPVAATVATVATLGSLWMSEVAGYIPCELCWFQRIAMYPLTVVLWVATWRRDAAAWLTVLPIAGVGAAISVWHIAIERNPSMSGPCDPQAPCAVLWVQEFGFLTLPTMALIGFAAIAALSLAARPRPEADDPGERTLAADTHGGDRRGHES
jgi:disulfide bond formation protein DsbB